MGHGPRGVGLRLEQAGKSRQVAAGGLLGISAQRSSSGSRPEAKDRVGKSLPNRRRGPAEYQDHRGADAPSWIRREIADARQRTPTFCPCPPTLTSAPRHRSGRPAPAQSIVWGPTTDVSVPTLSTGPHHESASCGRCSALQNWFTGSSLTVAVIDSGIQTGLDFGNRIVGFYDFTDGRGAIAIVAHRRVRPRHACRRADWLERRSRPPASTPVWRRASILLALRVLDKKGAGRTSNVIRALEFAVGEQGEVRDQGREPVARASDLTSRRRAIPLVQAVEAAVRSGLIVVAAAGNYGANPDTGVEGYAGIASPGNAPSALTVGAANTGRHRWAAGMTAIASFSSRGPSWFDGLAKPDVVASGRRTCYRIWSPAARSRRTYPGLDRHRQDRRSSSCLNGSSMAAGRRFRPGGR